MKQIILSVAIIVLVATSVGAQGRGASRAAAGNQNVYGDIVVNESQATGSKPITLDVILFNEYGNTIDRQRVSSNTRYRFNNLNSGRYYVVVEFESRELARFNVDLSSPLLTDVRQDVRLELQASPVSAGAEVISVADRYDRPAKTEPIFKNATDAAKNKRHDEAISLFRQVVNSDAADYPAWAELGTVYFIQKNYAEAEKAYLQAIAKRPDYTVALISLGRLRIAQKNFDGAIEALTQAVKVQPTSAQANYFLGEAYLQVKKGSLAVGYLNEAIKLDPLGMADAHLRLAALYNAVGFKDKAANEYEQFLQKVPAHPDKVKLQEYITANKKP